ncbi:MAG: hypothetical protein Q8K79_12180, partial [Solirubrobacteraceae bacterium]|nr:hypothetical protein [Solirubrobacteraceae bacterium]
MRHRLRLAAALTLVLALAPASARGDGLPTRTWEGPVSIAGQDFFEQDAGLLPGGRIVSMQQRLSSSSSARMGVTVTDGRSGAAEDTPLWGGPGGYYPRLATAPDGTVATAFSDGQLLHVHIRRPGAPWREAGAVHEGQTDFSDGRPLLAFTPLGHLVVTWPRKDPQGGQRLWLAELAPGADELTTPRPLDPPAEPAVVQVARDLAVSATGRIAIGYLQGPSRQHDLTARVAFGQLGGALPERHALPGIVTPWSWRAPQVDFDLAGGAAIAWHTVPEGFDQGAALGDLHLVLRRPDGTLRPAVELGQTPTHGPLDLAVSDLGEVLLGFDSAGGLAGGGGSWGYHVSGFRGVLGSTLLGRVGAPQPLVPRPGDYPRLAMNRRGDAVLAYSEFGTPGVVRVRRRVPGRAFGEPALVATGDLTPAGDGAYYGLSVGEVVLDEIGNAMVTWTGFGPIALGVTAAIDGPWLDVGLPGLPLGLELPAILPPLPALTLPGAGELELPAIDLPLPVRVDERTLRRAPAAAPARAAVPPLALSAAASTVRGVPRRLTLRVRCDRTCAVQASGRLAGASLRAFRGELKAGRTARLTVRLPAAARRRTV